MLPARRYEKATRPIRIGTVNVVRIGVVENRVLDVKGHAAKRVNHACEAGKTHPAVIVDADAKQLLDSATGQLDSACHPSVLVAVLEGEIDLAISVSGDIDPEVARDRQDADAIVDRVDGNHDHALRQRRGFLFLLIVVAPKQEKIDAPPIPNAGDDNRRLISGTGDLLVRDLIDAGRDVIRL